jgi:hypothetical protein
MAEPRLHETPWRRDLYPLVTQGLKSLSFLCYNCDALIIPEGCVSRITVRSQQQAESPPVDELRCVAIDSSDAVFADAPLGDDAQVTRSPAAHLGTTALQLYSTNRYRSVPVIEELRCRSCSSDVGYVIVGSDGCPLARPDEGGREYKFWYYTPQRGHVLRLADKLAWYQLAQRVPPVLSVRSDKKQLERAQQLAHELSLSIVDVPKIFAADGTFRDAAPSGYLRSLRRDEDAHDRLVPRNTFSEKTPADHVKGDRETPYISVTSSLSIGLMWSMPFGSLVVLNERAAALTGADLIQHSTLLSALNSDTVLVNRTKSAVESLYRGPVSALAVEELRATPVAMNGPDAPHRRSSLHAAFPRTVEELRLLTPMILTPDITSLLKTDMGMTLVWNAKSGNRFAVIRVSRNSIPAVVHGDTELDFPGALALARSQLTTACRLYYDRGGTGDLAFYEADLELFQYDRRITAVDHLRVRRLPFLLLWCGQRDDLALYAEDLRTIYKLKKGDDTLSLRPRL